MTVGARAVDILAEHGQWRIEPGLTEAELAALESRFSLWLNEDHRDFLSAGLPVGDGWPDWRNADDVTLRAHIGRPVRELLHAVRTGGLWHPAWGDNPGGDAALKLASAKLAEEPRVVPVYGVTFLKQGPGDPTVWAVQDGGRGVTVTAVAADLIGLAQLLTGRPVTSRSSVGDPPFVPAPPPAPEVPELAAPPFAPDPVDAPPAAVAPPRDPGAALAAAGVVLGEMQRHDDLLAHRAPMWTVPVPPGVPAVEAWLAVRARFPVTGLWPVLLTDMAWHRIGMDGVADETPVLAAELDGARWLEHEFEIRTADYEIPRHPSGFDADDPGDWRRQFADFDSRGEYTRLALIPTPADWLVPGLLQWSGAINSGVLGAEHAAILRRWSAHYGTEVLALDDESLVLVVDQPPRSLRDALTAALEAYLYCDDAVNTEAGSLDALARMLARPLWVFWWD
ncbi:hypothetical protein A5792_12145 [Mycolicibacterium peregrinum]|uniref:DUF4253 domain-containing protein n=1 Tax=Mycolicibacterium peregrinum TaxID=43304 RepID=A0A1A0RF62_MYCPR|nr:DUF4253 domain-containing protein [Mycolicibacterium peregrinum]OBB33155.1 hypothetical protein A5792_12145 [Mycolicibacterium peregrinum]